MRGYSYIFHTLLALFALGVSTVACAAGNELNLGMLPFSSENAAKWLLPLSLIGLITVLLAWKGTLRVLFLLWSAAVVVVLVRGYFFSPYVFDGWSGFGDALLLTLAALVALAGAWLVFRRQPKTR
ncbi:MAG: hypothetical protein IT160_20515 [Bryobacterales bacterium]|nr:hypothetical protein [Bryobacterales bacterium]